MHRQARLARRPRLVAGLLLTATLFTGHAHAASAPEQRGEATMYKMVVTLCGFAVQLAVQAEGGLVKHYVGESLPAKLVQLGITPQNTPHYELAEVYAPVGAACEAIQAEQIKMLQVGTP